MTTLIRVRVTETKDGWIARFTEKGRKRRARVPKDKDPFQYRALIEKQLRETGRFDSQLTSTGSFEILMQTFVEDLQERAERRIKGRYDTRYTLSPQRVAVKISHIKRHILPWFGHKDISAIDDLDIDDFQNSLLDRLSPNTVIMVVGTLAQFFKFLCKRKILTNNPMANFETVRQVQPEVGFVPTREEVYAVIKAAKSDRDATMILLAAQTGARIGEITPLTWDKVQHDRILIDVAANNRFIAQQNKTGVKRLIPIDAELQHRLRLLRIKGSKYIFEERPNKIFTSSQALKYVLHAACKNAGVNKFGWHALRRFTENEWEAMDLHPDVIQKLMGHQLGSRVTKARYRHVREEAILDAGNVVSLFERSA